MAAVVRRRSCKTCVQVNPKNTLTINSHPGVPFLSTIMSDILWGVGGCWTTNKTSLPIVEAIMMALWCISICTCDSHKGFIENILSCNLWMDELKSRNQSPFRSLYFQKLPFIAASPSASYPWKAANLLCKYIQSRKVKTLDQQKKSRNMPPFLPQMLIHKEEI